MKRIAWFGLVAVFAALVAGWSGCKRAPAASAVAPKTPTVRVYVVTTVAGALEPCGCVKDMLGGVDHAAALLAGGRESAPSSLFVASGPLLFMDPALRPDSQAQDLWKAEALAESLKDMGLVAWAPGANDWAAGADELARLRAKAGATLLAANLTGATAGAVPTRVLEIQGYKVGIAGVSLPLQSGLAPAQVQARDAREALTAGLATLHAAGAQIRIALLAMPRGEALRLLEAVSGFQLAVVGKPVDRGEINDGPTLPIQLGDTLVVQTANHLQAVAIVDLYVRGSDFRFQDGSGLAQAERRAALESRVAELESRLLDASQPDSGVKAEDVEARRADLAKLQQELGKLTLPQVPAEGSFFRYELGPVRESSGSDAAVAERMKAFYRRVNQHNRTAFADRKPPAVPPGKSGYVGVDKCVTCHAEEKKVWDSTAHPRAYTVLESQEKQFNLECVGCHVTGYDKPGGSTVTQVEALRGIQCENCHGPGSRHLDAPTNKDFIQRSPPRTLCASECHHAPHVKPDWSVDQAWPRILGPGHGK